MNNYTEMKFYMVPGTMFIIIELILRLKINERMTIAKF